MIILSSGQIRSSQFDSIIIPTHVRAGYVGHNSVPRVFYPRSVISRVDFSLQSYLSLVGMNDSSGESLTGNGESRHIRVLIIDDDVTMRETIGFMLEDLAVEFDTVGSGEEGLAKLKEQTYDLILLDLVLHTGSHGIDIYNEIHKHEHHPRVVLMTASGSREPIFEEAIRTCRRILRKPFSLCEVKRAIDELVRRFGLL